MKKVTLVVPPSPVNASFLSNREGSMVYDDNSSPSLGLSYIAANLKNFSVAGYDARFDQHESIDAIADKILCDEPDIIGFTSTTFTINNIVKLSYAIKKKSPRTNIVIGGSHVSSRIN